jgi:hypothetical protein
MDNARLLSLLDDVLVYSFCELCFARVLDSGLHVNCIRSIGSSDIRQGFIIMPCKAGL